MGGKQKRGLEIISITAALHSFLPAGENLCLSQKMLIFPCPVLCKTDMQ